jgi:sensor c-di-GMP phosphodiesterase-like protein
VRLRVYQSGAVKDIRIVNRDGSVLCSAYSETLEFDKEWPTRDRMLPTHDQALRLFRVEQFFGTAVGILKDIDERTSVVAILGFNSNAFDIMPAELRDHGEMAVELDGGQTIVTSSHSVNSSQPALVEVVSGSDIYPLRTVIRVDEAALREWNNDFYIPIMAVSALLGLAFGVLFCRAFIRDDDPVAEIDRGLRAGEFVPYLQPIFDLHTRSIIGCEALVRWVRSDGTVVPPFQFIPLVEGSGRIQEMTWQLLMKALDALSDRLRHDKLFKLSINVTAPHLMSADFLPQLRKIVADARVSPRQIVLELTEREEIEDLFAMAARIHALRDHGFRVAMDDVGTGHNGLSQIQALGADVIKIDKFFVDSICGNATAASIIEMLVKLARDMRMSIVAEGIETDSQRSALVACGVTQGQGYLVSPPLPADKFLDLLDRQEHVASADTCHPSVPQVA